jgi:apolipoprotein N-acyltransferase
MLPERFRHVDETALASMSTGYELAGVIESATVEIEAVACGGRLSVWKTVWSDRLSGAERSATVPSVGGARPWAKWRADGLTPTLAIAGGTSLATSGEPSSWNLMAIVAVALLAEALSRSLARPRPLRAAFLSGLVFGTAANAIALSSLVELLVHFGHFSTLAAVPTAALCWVAQALPYALSTLLAAFVVRRDVPLLYALPLSSASMLGICPQLFPWHLGATQVDFLWFAQVADLGGEGLLDFLVCALGTALWSLARESAALRLRAGLVVGLCGLLPLAYGVVRLAQIEEARAQAEVVHVGVIQPSVDIDEKHEPSRRGEILERLRTLTKLAETDGAEMTVWPETAYPYELSRARTRLDRGDRALLGSGVEGPIVLGAVTYGPDAAGRPRRFNSAWVVERDGALSDRVDKTRLLAFGEYVPFWHLIPALQARFASPGFLAGKPDVVRAAGAKLGILICYEDLFFSHARSVVQRGAELLVNMTNDAWFRRSRTAALHDMMAHLRAIETRRDFVRAVNTGVSSVTLATGETVARTEIFTRTHLVEPLRRLSMTTLYVRLGDWVTPLCGLALFTLFALRRRPSGHDR